LLFVNMDFQPLKYRFVKAAQHPEQAVTLLLLHGTGGDENDLLPLGQQFGPAVNLLSVRGQVLENGMPRFFRRLAMGVFDEQDVRFRAHELVHFVKGLAGQLGFDPAKVVALGYSNGANIAGAVLMLHPELLAGAILLRPMQPLPEPNFAAKGPVPVLMVSGSQDSTVNPVATRAYQELLTANHFAVDHQSLPTGHQLTQKDLVLALDWFKANF
jgi:phospholipase/carboxylesterase